MHSTASRTLILLICGLALAFVTGCGGDPPPKTPVVTTNAVLKRCKYAFDPGIELVPGRPADTYICTVQCAVPTTCAKINKPGHYPYFKLDNSIYPDGQNAIGLGTVFMDQNAQICETCLFPLGEILKPAGEEGAIPGFPNGGLMFH